MGGGVSKILWRNRGRRHIANVMDRYKEGRVTFSPETALRNVWMIPYYYCKASKLSSYSPLKNVQSTYFGPK